jgi:hypothetical protein
MTKIRVTGRFQKKGLKYKAKIRVTGRFQKKVFKYKNREERVKTNFGSLNPFVSDLDLDLAGVTSSLFRCESLKNKEELTLDDSIVFSVKEFNIWNKLEVKQLMQDILSFMVQARPPLRFKAAQKIRRPRKRVQPKRRESVTLFSGGIDSLSGILNVQTNVGSTSGVFVNHSNISSIVKDLETQVLNSYNTNVFQINIRRSPAAGIQQLRGFVYLVFGAIVAKVLKTNKIFISESGPIMYQPLFLPTDLVTLTTHPTLILLSKQLFKELYNIEFQFYEPFEDLTKAEVISLCPECDAIRYTNSCISTRFAYSQYSHCGRCYGCLVRRLSSIVAGVKDAEYGKDVLVQDLDERSRGGWPGKRIQSSNLTDLMVLLRFARDFLEDKLPDYTLSKIREFNKDNLFKRFALDVISGVYILYGKDKTGRNLYVKKFFEQCMQDRVVSADILENRVAEVREKKYKPNFDYIL